MAQIYTALYKFETDDDQELPLNENDKLMAKGEVDEDGWIEVTNFSTGLSGLVPLSYLQLDSDLTTGGPPPAGASTNQPTVAEVPVIEEPYVPPVEANGNSDDIPSGAEAANFNNRSAYESNTIRSNYTPSLMGAASLGTVSKGSYDTKSHDPIKNIIGDSSRIFGHLKKHGTEEFVNGLFLGEGSPKLNASVKFLNQKEIHIENKMWRVVPEDAEDWQIIVERSGEPKNPRKDRKGNILFAVKAYPDIHQYGTALRSLKDFEWLDSQLRIKFPFLTIPDLTKKDQVPPLNRYASFISNHPVLKNSYAVNIFLSFRDEKNFKDAKKTLVKDQILKGEMMRMIEVSEDSKHHSDLTVGISDTSQNIGRNQEMYTSGIKAVVDNFKSASDSEVSKLNSYEDMANCMESMSKGLEQLSVHGSGALATSMKNAAINLKNIANTRNQKKTVVLVERVRLS